MKTPGLVLIEKAIGAAQHSYSPYSNYKVGAALMTEDGQIFEGCNVENASYGATICAERTAALKAVYAGRKKFKIIAIYGENAEGDPDFAFPCGICRQFLAEFAAPDMKVLICKSPDQYQEYSLAELLPAQFSKDHLD